jgi:hypothetical protein
VTATPLAWPNLGYVRLGTLDHLVLEITPADLRYAASVVESLFQHVSAPVIAEVLRHFADTPSAIKAANPYKRHTPDPHTPHAILGLWRALHYYVSRELYPDKRRGKVLGIVADIWAPVKDRTIEADIGKHSARAKQQLDLLVGMGAERGKDRRQVIAALDLDLKLKAAQEPKRDARKSKKSARKKSK